jgi:hypothetical protein
MRGSVPSAGCVGGGSELDMRRAPSNNRMQQTVGANLKTGAPPAADAGRSPDIERRTRGESR